MYNSLCNELVILSSDESDLGQFHKSCRLLSFSDDSSDNSSVYS